MRSEDDTTDLGAGEWRRHWTLSGWGVRLTVETQGLGSEDDTGD